MISSPPHPRDISVEDLQAAIKVQRNGELLRQLVGLSRSTFGFYPSYFPYTINYPWVAEHLTGLPNGARVLDIGAGISPLPLFLAEKGVFVDCVDNSRHTRKIPFAEDWNEWGFFDYASLHPNLSAYHCDILNFTPATGFDAIYSAAVLAHMPRVARENTLRHCHDWLKQRGILLLTIDIIPSTDFLWNRSEGIEVEPPIKHGTIETVLHQLRQLGFRMDEVKTVRAVYKSRTDLLLIACSKSRDPSNGKLNEDGWTPDGADRFN